MEGTGEIGNIPEAPASPCRIYSAIDWPEFRQGEILSNLTQYRYNPVDDVVDAFLHEYVLVASQDCDLFQDFAKKAGGLESDLNSVLLFPAQPTIEMKGVVPAGADIWKRVVQKKDERYHALQAAPVEADSAGVGWPDLVVDFKRFFSTSTFDLAYQIQSGAATRRCVLEVPYREHFQARVAFYLQRVAIPKPHNIGPIKKQA